MIDSTRLAAAYESCARDGRGHYENFPVGSLLLPAHMRKHVAAVYAFARAADDFADEGDRNAGERLELLDGWAARLRQAVSGAESDRALRTGEPEHAREIFLALGASIRECSLPVELLEDLLSAFRQDVTVTRYATWTEVLDYCRRSAKPVGRLVLRIAGYRQPSLDLWSDAICTALQLTNFWQDFGVDYRRGRVYLPLEEQRAHGAREEDLAAGAMGSPWQHALIAATARTRRLFDEGRPLCDALRGRLRFELRATWLGGTRILDRLDASGFETAAFRPTLGAADIPWFAWQMLMWAPTRTAFAQRTRSS
ncbi:MAG: squalene synthase HpnC [Acidobacteria bacterium]|nr:squalene synthase HpnC [Acidobacteriota bacterium]